jgi:hypothetical protein
MVYGLSIEMPRDEVNEEIKRKTLLNQRKQ